MKPIFQSVLALVGMVASAGIGILAPPAVAQTPTLKREQLVGTWVRVLDTSRENWKGIRYWRGHLVAEFLTLNADSTSKRGTEVDGRHPANEVSKNDAWTLRGDTVRFGRKGLYRKYRAKLTGEALTLTQAMHWKSNSVVEGKVDEDRECVEAFVRYDSLKPLPAPTPAHDCKKLDTPLIKPPMPKAAELVGTWAAVTATLWQGKPLCADRGVCTVITYDTLMFKADSTMSRKNIVVSPAHPQGEEDTFGGVASEPKWWIASDTLWASYVMTVNGKPVDIVYNSDSEQPRKAEPVKRARADVQFEDDGRYLLYDGSAYQRVPGAP